MKFLKIFGIEISIVTLVIGLFFAPKIYQLLSQENVIFTEPSGLTLNDSGGALMLGDGSFLEVSMTPKNILPLDKITFIIKNVDAQEVKATIRGLNMNMGEHTYVFKKISPHHFTSTLMLPSCSIDMHWQMDIYVTKNSTLYGGGFQFWSKK